MTKGLSFLQPVGAELYRIRKDVIVPTSWQMQTVGLQPCRSDERINYFDILQTNEPEDDTSIGLPIYTTHEIVAEFNWGR